MIGQERTLAHWLLWILNTSGAALDTGSSDRESVKFWITYLIVNPQFEGLLSSATRARAIPRLQGSIRKRSLDDLLRGDSSSA